jgi:hypothetical protein
VLTGAVDSTTGPRLCGPCAGGADYACSRCDLPGPAYAHSQCARCVLTDRLHAAFADTDGALHGQYATLVTVLADSPQPESVLANWLTPRNPGARLLTRLARENTPLTHALLAELPQTQPLLHLRRLLVFAAVLPPREQEYLHRLGPWLREHLATRPAHHARLVHPYAEWHVLHRARRKTRHRHALGYGAAIYARARITAALDLLAWLDQHHSSLGQLTQNQLEQWLDQPANQHKPIGGFLTWATKARHARELTVPARRHGRSPAIFDEEERWQQLRRCLHEDTLPLPVRLVATLTLLFGVTTSRILELTTGDVTFPGDTVLLAFGGSPLELPPRVADLVRAQHELARTVELNAPELDRWLFPGQRAALPVNSAHMSDLLTAAGLDARQGRHAALVDLAAALPPPVLASLLGVHISTAIAWSHRAQQDWSTYLAARHSERRG